jgi:hypothetical protein
MSISQLGTLAALRCTVTDLEQLPEKLAEAPQIQQIRESIANATSLGQLSNAHAYANPTKLQLIGNAKDPLRAPKSVANTALTFGSKIGKGHVPNLPGLARIVSRPLNEWNSPLGFPDGEDSNRSSWGAYIQELADRWRSSRAPVPNDIRAKPAVPDIRERLKLPKSAMAGKMTKAAFRIYSPPEDEEEEEEEKFPTGGLLGAGLVGGGAMALPYMLGSDAQFNAAHKGIGDFISATAGRTADGTYPNMPDRSTVLTRYQEGMSHASALNPFGIPVGNLLAKVRTYPGIMERIGMGDYVAKSPQSYLAAKKHYGQFRSGPIPAWYHQVGIKGASVPTEIPGAEGVDYADYMLPKFRQFWRAKGWGQVMPAEMDTSVMSIEEQAELMREFHASLSPAEQAEKIRVESGVWGPGTEGNVKNYKGMIDQGHNVRDTLKTVGKYVGGAAGIYALYRLAKYIMSSREEEEEEEEKKKRVRQPQLKAAGWEEEGLSKEAGGPKGLGGISKSLRELLSPPSRRTSPLGRPPPTSRHPASTHLPSRPPPAPFDQNWQRPGPKNYSLGDHLKNTELPPTTATLQAKLDKFLSSKEFKEWWRVRQLDQVDPVSTFKLDRPAHIPEGLFGKGRQSGKSRGPSWGIGHDPRARHKK